MPNGEDVRWMVVSGHSLWLAPGPNATTVWSLTGRNPSAVHRVTRAPELRSVLMAQGNSSAMVGNETGLWTAVARPSGMQQQGVPSQSFDGRNQFAGGVEACLLLAGRTSLRHYQSSAVRGFDVPARPAVGIRSRLPRRGVQCPLPDYGEESLTIPAPVTGSRLLVHRLSDARRTLRLQAGFEHV